ncbi:flagellar hook protein FlgE [bacterium]|nr:flagellar hook protein FlgE [bacterium]
MSVLSAMYSGISGLNANSTAMEVIGNNIANVNTPGYKGARADFSDVLSKTMAGGFSVGRGSQVADVNQIFSQGAFQATDNVTDLALEGAGFFMVNAPGEEGSYYTRAGAFLLDSDGYLVNQAGFRVQGFGLGDDGVHTGTPGDIKIDNAPLPPLATGDGTDGSGINIHLNLDAGADLNPGGASFDINNPDETSNFVNTITVYDSLGNDHQISIYYRKTNEDSVNGNTWEWYAVVDADDAASGTDTIAAQGSLSFSTEGALLSETLTSSSFDFAGGATQAQVIGFDFGESVAEGGTGFTGSTQFGESSSVAFQGQDGYPPSYLTGLEIGPDGVIVGRYGNGELVSFAQVAVARFNAMNELAQVGGNLYAETQRSGEPIVGVAEEAGNGRIFSNTLELSNVDIAQQFVEMITTQRAFQANSRSITTSDEMLTEILNTKR